MDLSAITIVRATPAQAKRTLDIHHPFWGVPRNFSLERYYEVEESLNHPEQPWAKHGEWTGYTTWALVPRDDPETLDLLASCETYKRHALVLAPGETEPKDEVSYGIASVFCNPTHRGNAYPRHLLSLLHYVLAEPTSLPPFPAAWGAPPTIPGFGNAAFSVLYSDVGPTYYTRCTKGDIGTGWVPHNPGKRVWDVPGADETVDWRDYDGEWVDYAGLEKLGAIGSERIRKNLPAKGDTNKTRMAILPDGGWFQNAPTRYQLSNNARPDAKFGLVLPASASGEQPFLVWGFDKEGKRMVVGHASGNVPWSAVVAAAKHEGCTSIESWADYGWDEQASAFEHMTEKSIPALAAYTLGEDAKIEWLHNEKYPWM